VAAFDFCRQPLRARRVSSVFKNQPFNWFLLAVSSGILRWHQMVIESKTCELFSSHHVDSIDAALANASGFPLMLLVLLIVKPTKIRILYGHFKE
jgi:hypothetical protein